MINPLDSRAAWLAARAKNALRRRLLIGGVTGGALFAELVVFILVPQEKRHTQPIGVAAPIVQIDTLPMADAITLGQRRAAAADSALADARSRASVAAAMVKAVDSIDPAMARRDSLTALMTNLKTLLTTAQTAPLPSSYRALAASPALAGNAHVKALLDSLGDIEQERDAMGTGGGGGADPIFVALTSRLTDIGRAIESEGDERRIALRDQLSASTSPTHRVVALAIDTAQWLAERDSARSQTAMATDQLASARAQLVDQADEGERARAAAAAIAPPLALMGAAIVFGLVLGFVVSLIGEIRQPRLADAAEVERVTGSRALATIRLRAPAPERARRDVDRTIPAYVDPSADSYQLTYLRVARNAASHVVVTVLSDEPLLAAIAAVNLAAIATDEARTAIVIDTDTVHIPVSTVLGLQSHPGTADIAVARGSWAETARIATLGRGRTVDVVPAGIGPVSPADLTELFRREGAGLARHYDAIFLVATFEHASVGLPAALPIADTIISARAGHTLIAELVLRITALQASGANVLGVMVWDAPLPVFPATTRTSKAPSPGRPSESRALVDAS